MKYHSPDEFSDYVRRYGAAVRELPLPVREAFVAAGMPIPAMTQQVALSIPPGPGFCAHCGQEVPVGQHEAGHALPMLEHARDDDGEPMRLQVNHCDACLDSLACKPEAPTPGTGLPPNQPGGFCDYAELEVAE